MNVEQQIAAIEAEIAPILKAGIDARQYAEGIWNETEAGEHYEVRALHTKSGAPFTSYTPE